MNFFCRYNKSNLLTSGPGLIGYIFVLLYLFTLGLSTLFSNNNHFFVVVSRRYGVNGGDPKKIDSKYIILDFQVIKQMTDQTFIETLKSKTEFFMKEILAHRKASGKNTKYM